MRKGCRMNDREVKTFVELAHMHNFSRTAEKLYLSQTTITTRIKSLEQELGGPLFIRNTHTVELTPAGHQFLPFAERLCALIEEGRQSVNFTRRFNRFLSVAAPESVWTDPFIRSFGRLADAHKEICFKIICAHSSDIIQGILNGSVDIGFSLRRPMYTNISARPFFSSNFYLVANPDIPLPAERVTPENISLFPLISTRWSQAFQEWFGAYYPPNTHIMEVNQVSILIKFLLAGSGISFLPERSAREYFDSKRLISIPFDHRELMPVEQTHAIYMEGNTQFFSALLDEFREIIFPPDEV